MMAATTTARTTPRPPVDPDTDDRLPCACDGDHGRNFDQRCLKRTRHESGLCADCRPDELELRALFGDR